MSLNPPPAVPESISRDEGRPTLALPALLEEAFIKHYAYAARLAYMLCGDPPTAEDIAHEALARSAPKLGDLPSEGVRPYLRRTLINLALSARRLQTRIALDEGHLESLEAPEVSPADQDIWSAVCALPARQRACVVLRFFEDLTESETASVLGCAVGTVKSQTSKALKKLRKEIAHES